MKTVKLRSGLAIAALAVLVWAPSARADDRQVPVDVGKWFAAHEAAVIDANTGSTDGNLSFPAGSTLGTPVSVYQVSDQFVSSGDPSESQLVAAEQWAAPVLSSGVAVGSITACRAPDGSVQFMMATDNWSDAEMMVSAPSTGRYVNDHRNGAFIVEGKSVHQVTPAATRGKAHRLAAADVFTTTAATLRDAIRQQRADDAAAGAKAGEPVAGGDLIDLQSFVATHGTSQPGSGLSAGQITGLALGGGVVLLGALIGVPLYRKRQTA